MEFGAILLAGRHAADDAGKMIKLRPSGYSLEIAKGIRSSLSNVFSHCEFFATLREWF
jgi:hypothetical protein